MEYLRLDFPVANFGRGCPVQPFKRAIEIGEVAKGACKGDPGYAPVPAARVRQHAMCPHKPAVEYELGKRVTFGSLLSFLALLGGVDLVIEPFVANTGRFDMHRHLRPVREQRCCRMLGRIGDRMSTGYRK